MKPEDIQFVRETRQYAVALIQTCSTTITPMAPMLEFALREAHIKLRLITLLIESEGLKDKAEHLAAHNGSYCGGACSRTDADWISAKKKEILG